MKKLTLFILLIPFIIFAEEKHPQSNNYDVGLSFSGNSSDLGLLIKKTNNFGKWRYSLNATESELKFDDILSSFDFDASLELGFGAEFKKNLQQEMSFIYGLDLRLIAIINGSEQYFSANGALKANLVMGISKTLFQNWDLAFEYRPYIQYSHISFTTWEISLLPNFFLTARYSINL